MNSPAFTPMGAYPDKVMLFAFAANNDSLAAVRVRVCQQTLAAHCGPVNTFSGKTSNAGFAARRVMTLL